MCFGRIILPIETNESTVFLLNFNFIGAIQVYNSSCGVKNLFEIDRTSDRTSYFKV